MEFKPTKRKKPKAIKMDTTEWWKIKLHSATGAQNPTDKKVKNALKKAGV